MATMDYENENDRYDGMESPSQRVYEMINLSYAGISSLASYLRRIEANTTQRNRVMTAIAVLRPVQLSVMTAIATTATDATEVLPRAVV